MQRRYPTKPLARSVIRVEATSLMERKMPTMNPSAQIVRDAVQAAIKNGRSFHDYWYYTMSFTDHALFAGKQEFEARADAVYKRELERRDRNESERATSVESYWKEKQGDEYGSY